MKYFIYKVLQMQMIWNNIDSDGIFDSLLDGSLYSEKVSSVRIIRKLIDT